MQFKNIDRNNKEDVSLLMATNHRYFVRFVVVTVVVNMLLALGLGILASFLANIAVESTKDSNTDVVGAVFIVLVSIMIAYLIVCVIQLSRIISLHKRISATEEHFVVDAGVVR